MFSRIKVLVGVRIAIRLEFSTNVEFKVLDTAGAFSIGLKELASDQHTVRHVS